MTLEASRTKPGSTHRRRGTPAAAVVAAALLTALAAGCTSQADTTPETAQPTVDPAITRLETAARTLASDAVAPSTTPLTSGTGQADRKARLTLSGFRGHWPLTIGVACHGQGDLTLRVDTTPVTLACARDQTHVLQPARELGTTGSLTVAVESPTTSPAAWAVTVFDGSPG